MAIAVTAVGLTLRLLWQLAVGFYVDPVTFEPDEIARNIVGGRGAVYDLFGTEWRSFGLSFYQWWLAFLHLIGGGPDGYVAIGIAQALTSSAAVLPTHALAARLGGARAGFFAAAVVAVHPALVIYAARVTETNIDVLLSALIAATATGVAHGASARGSIRFGVASALGAISRPTLGAAAWAMLAAMALFERRRALLLAAALILVGSAPTTLRNVVGGYGGGTPGNCIQLWVGNNPAAAGDAFGRDGRSVFDSMSSELRERVVGRPEAEQGRAFCDAALSFMTRDPLATAAWWATKFGYFWWATPHGGRSYPDGWYEVYLAGYLVEASLAAAGIALLWRGGTRRELVYLVTMAVTLSAAQTFFYVEGRHRLLVEPILASLAAVPVALAWAARFPPRSRVVAS